MCSHSVCRSDWKPNTRLNDPSHCDGDGPKRPDTGSPPIDSSSHHLDIQVLCVFLASQWTLSSDWVGSRACRTLRATRCSLNRPLRWRDRLRVGGRDRHGCPLGRARVASSFLSTRPTLRASQRTCLPDAGSEYCGRWRRRSRCTPPQPSASPPRMRSLRRCLAAVPTASRVTCLRDDSARIAGRRRGGTARCAVARPS